MSTSNIGNVQSPANAGFAERFAVLRERRGPFCLGLDPSPALLDAWGLEDSVEGLRHFCFTTFDAAADQLSAIKPQSAYFERFGSKGIAVLEDCIAAIRDRRSLALLDVKRGDIGRVHGKITPELKRRYIDFLLDHRFNPTEQYADKLSPDAQDIPYCFERGGNTIYLSGNFTGNVEALRGRYDAVKQLGLIDHALVYIGDETKDWNQMRRRSDAIRICSVFR